MAPQLQWQNTIGKQKTSQGYLTKEILCHHFIHCLAVPVLKTGVSSLIIFPVANVTKHGATLTASVVKQLVSEKDQEILGSNSLSAMKLMEYPGSLSSNLSYLARML